MKVKKIKPLGPKLERYHIDKDSDIKSIGVFKRLRENELRQKFKKKMKNRGKSIKK